jgi:uncharacterized protein (DUF1800 family)
MLNRRSFLKLSGGVAAASAILPTVSLADQLKREVLNKAKKNSERPFPLFVYHRMGFGPTSTQLQVVAPFHFEKYVEAQLYPEAIADPVCEQKLKEANLLALDKSLKNSWKDYKVAADELKKKEEKKSENKSTENDLRQTPIREIETATWIRAIFSEKQLQEVVVQFWHDHFSINGYDGNISPTMPHFDRDVIRKHAFGNFSAMVEAVTRSPAMLLYLDNGLNQSANPNENFARELFELHTLGAENYLCTLDRKKVFVFEIGKSKGYVDGDVYESARAFTGWRENSNQKDATNTGEFNYYDAWHDRFQKIVLGHSIPEYQPPEKDGMDVIGYVSKHEGTAHAICKKLCMRLVADHPSEILVLKAKKVFMATQKDPEQLRKVICTILLSQEFRDPVNIKLKRPFEYTVSLIRALKKDNLFIPDREFLNRQGQGGQKLFAWKSPDGYPDFKERWMTSSGLLYRFQFANQMIEKKLIDPDEFKGIEDPAVALQKRVLGYATLAQTKIIEEFIRSHPQPNGAGNTNLHPTLKASALLAMMSPELQWK